VADISREIRTSADELQLALALLNTWSMSNAARKWRQVLEERYGVQPEFAGHLLPLLERLAVQQPSVEQWEQMLHGVAAAYRVARPAGRPPGGEDEARVLADQFLGELRKIEESLKVLDVYLERLRQRMKRPTQHIRVLH
jgi:hypothetical protein